jgi:hypothetical protein
MGGVSPLLKKKGADAPRSPETELFLLRPRNEPDERQTGPEAIGRRNISHLFSKEIVMFRKALAGLVLAGLLIAGSSDGGPFEAASAQAQKGERHPRIHAAIRELREARKELDEGAKIFGGHRVKALKAVDEAIEQLQKALDFTEKK